MAWHAFELCEPVLGESPEVLDAVDVAAAVHELVVTVVRTQVLSVADVHQAVVVPPAVGVDDDVEAHPAADHLLQSRFRFIGQDLGVDPTRAFENAEDDDFAPRTPAAFALDPTRAEVRLIDFDLSPEGTLGPTDRGDPAASVAVRSMAKALIRRRNFGSAIRERR